MSLPPSALSFSRQRSRERPRLGLCLLLIVLLVVGCGGAGESEAPKTLPDIAGSWVDTQARTLGCPELLEKRVYLKLEQTGPTLSGELYIPTIGVMTFRGTVTVSDELTGVAELIRVEGGDIRFDVALKVEREANLLVGSLSSQVNLGCEDQSDQLFTASVSLIERAEIP